MDAPRIHEAEANLGGRLRDYPDGDARGPARRARYQPPASPIVREFAELIEGTPRWDGREHQLSFLSSPKSRSDQDRIYLAGDERLVRAPRIVAIIGTREVSIEGAARARRLSKELVVNDVVIVSGLAKGIDTEALRSAIRNGGRTIGVIGTPLTQAYPAENAPLQEEIYREHLLISQFAPGERVFKSNFPQRNRLMAIISDATVVIEASDSSGTLHQAAECARLGRWLFIARSVVEDRSLTWPSKFLSNERCRVLDSTEELLATVYPR